MNDAPLPNPNAAMRPDIAARVFCLKLNALMNDISDFGALGEVIARMYVIELQKRGLPRAHIICILSDADSPRITDRYDDISGAAPPDPAGDPALWSAVTPSMIHVPCGSMNPKSPCAIDGVCSKGRPKRFRPHTIEVE